MLRNLLSPRRKTRASFEDNYFHLTIKFHISEEMQLEMLSTYNMKCFHFYRFFSKQNNSNNSE